MEAGGPGHDKGFRLGEICGMGGRCWANACADVGWGYCSCGVQVAVRRLVVATHDTMLCTTNYMHGRCSIDASHTAIISQRTNHDTDLLPAYPDRDVLIVATKLLRYLQKLYVRR